MVKKLLLAIFVAGPLMAAIMLGIHLKISLNSAYTGPNVNFEISSGETFSKINQRLFEAGLIENKRLFHYYSKFKGVMNKFKVGSYEFKAPITMPEIIETISQGKSILLSVTIPEGKNIFDIAQIMVENKILKDKKEFIELAKSADLLSHRKINAKRLEGYLFPDTYKFSPKVTAKKVLKTLIENHFKATEKLNFKNQKLSRHELITLASVVEKETGAAFERPTIAGVFFNRLKKGMKLQSDPTTIYGIYERFDGNLRKKDLLESTPYNTYTVKALPIGPIANPGLEAIKAVLNPKAHDFLYFVSKNNGTHIFSKNYKDHQKAVNHWQKTKANRKGRSWRDLKQ